MKHTSMGRALAAGILWGLTLLTAADRPPGWFLAGSRPAEYETGNDPKMTYRGGPSVYLKSIAARTTGFGTVMQKLDVEQYRGQRVRLSGFVRGNNITGWAGLWMRVDRASGGRSLSFDNMQDRPITGTADWTRCDVVLDVPEASGGLYMGMLLSGAGEVWLDDWKIEPVPTTVATTDRRARLPVEPQNLDFEK